MVAFSGVGGLPSVTLPSLCSFLSPVPTQLRSPLHLPPLCFLEEIDRQRHAHTHTSVHSAKGERVWRSLNSPSRRTSVWVRRTSAAMDGEEATSRFKRVCVFCGSNSGNRPVFSNAALDLGRELARRRIDLVYGGGSVGLMGLVSRTVFDGGCSVVGVIPAALMPQEISGETVGDVQVVSDMHERKAEMARQSDAFIALPGGYGTMEELLEMITWSQLGIHNKPVGLLNVDGYYDSLLALFDNGVSEGFIKPTARYIVVSAPTARELIMKMEQYAPSHVQVAPSQSWEIAHLGYTTLPRQT